MTSTLQLTSSLSSALVLVGHLFCVILPYSLPDSCISWMCSAAMAMQELKLALKVPQRMGWNGDPCAPTRWDAWEGVTCNFAADNSGLVVSHMYVSSLSLVSYGWVLAVGL